MPHKCVCLLSTLSPLMSGGWGERLEDIKKASEKRHVKILPQQMSAKTLMLLQLQSQTLSQNTSIICSPMCELLPHIQLFTSHSNLLFEYGKRGGGAAWLFICRMK